MRGPECRGRLSIHLRSAGQCSRGQVRIVPGALRRSRPPGRPGRADPRARGRDRVRHRVRAPGTRHGPPERERMTPLNSTFSPSSQETRSPASGSPAEVLRRPGMARGGSRRSLPFGRTGPEIRPVRERGSGLPIRGQVREDGRIPEAQEIVESRESKYLSPATAPPRPGRERPETDLLLGLYRVRRVLRFLRQDVILALGEIGAQAAVESLIETLDDTAGKKGTRMFARGAWGRSRTPGRSAPWYRRPTGRIPRSGGPR
ncbi:MAG: hypothetical protein MZU97_12525 [Bacillus subtilis]|nr:hypothetical protein [Bacillus subtilis]